MRPDQALQDRRLHPVATWVLGCKGPFFRVPVPRSSAGYLLPGVLLGAHTSSLCLWPTPNSTRTQLPFQSFFPIFFPKRLPSTVIFLVVQCCLFLSLVPVIFSLKLVRSFLFPFPFLLPVVCYPSVVHCRMDAAGVGCAPPRA